jgi:hypothetical protein
VLTIYPTNYFHELFESLLDDLLDIKVIVDDGLGSCVEKFKEFVKYEDKIISTTDNLNSTPILAIMLVVEDIFKVFAGYDLENYFGIVFVETDKCHVLSIEEIC